MKKPAGKLEGLQEIADFFGWSLSKTRGKVDDLSEAGVILKERYGTPPKIRWCAFEKLLLAWIQVKAANREII